MMFCDTTKIASQLWNICENVSVGQWIFWMSHVVPVTHQDFFGFFYEKSKQRFPLPCNFQNFPQFSVLLTITFSHHPDEKRIVKLQHCLFSKNSSCTRWRNPRNAMHAQQDSLLALIWLIKGDSKTIDDHNFPRSTMTVASSTACFKTTSSTPCFKTTLPGFSKYFHVYS